MQYKKIIKTSVKILLPIIFISGILLFLDFGAGDTPSSLEDLAQDEYLGLKVKPLVLDDQVIDFPFTDDNTGESIIIKSDKKVYYGLSEADVYTSLTNTTSQTQKTALLFYFSENNGEVATVAEVDDNKLRFVNFFKDNIKVKESVLGPALKKRESMPDNFKAKAATQIVLAPNETIYIKSQIQYSPGSAGEFWIETLGENGGYGLLDPWYAPPVLIKGGVKIKGGVTVGKVDQGDTSTAAAGITAPTVADYQESNWTNSSTGSEVTGTATWQTNDIIIVVGATEDSSKTLATPTATGLTFSLVTSTGGANNTNTYLWSATAGSNGSGTITSTTDGNDAARGISAFVYRGSGGLGNNNTLVGSTAKTISLTRGTDNSAVVIVLSDWNATTDVTTDPTPSGGTEREESNTSGRYTNWVTNWGDQGTAGTTSYGITNHTGTVDMSGIVVEVKGE